jgi:hypothetical protein
MFSEARDPNLPGKNDEPGTRGGLAFGGGRGLDNCVPGNKCTVTGDSWHVWVQRYHLHVPGMWQANSWVVMTCSSLVLKYSQAAKGPLHSGSTTCASNRRLKP